MAHELETRGQQPFKFCVELYRSADFFMLKPLYTFVERYLGNYCDERIKWLYTFGNSLDDYYKEQRARIWIEDLKSAILETERWNTPIVTNMLKEFVWAGKGYFTRIPAFAPHLNLVEWFTNNTDQYVDRARTLCRAPVWRTEPAGPT